MLMDQVQSVEDLDRKKKLSKEISVPVLQSWREILALLRIQLLTAFKLQASRVSNFPTASLETSHH